MFTQADDAMHGTSDYAAQVAHDIARTRSRQPDPRQQYAWHARHGHAGGAPGKQWSAADVQGEQLEVLNQQFQAGVAVNAADRGAL